MKRLFSPSNSVRLTTMLITIFLILFESISARVSSPKTSSPKITKTNQNNDIDVVITGDYCSVDGKVVLQTVDSYSSYVWSNGETTPTITVDIAGVYSVTVTDSNGNTGTASFNISNELVTNGDFSDGNTGFTTPANANGNSYTYKANLPNSNNELYAEGTYGVGNDAHEYHSGFYGIDHTTGDGNFMIVNGYPGSPQPTVWQQTITVEPNTDYYFSAWGISLNQGGNYAELQFSINGSTVGSVAYLDAGQNNDDNPWKSDNRFYGSWNSGSSTTAVLAIVDLQTAQSGNDFGLDDISFGTLAPNSSQIDVTADESTICVGETIQLEANLTEGREPYFYNWTGPNGYTSTEENPTITNATSDNSGTYVLTVTDGYGCGDIIDSTTVAVINKPRVNAGVDQIVCDPSDNIITLTGQISGTAQSAVWSTDGSGTFGESTSTLSNTYTLSQDDINNGTVNFYLTATNNICDSVSSMTVEIYEAITDNISILNVPQCAEDETGELQVTATGGTGNFYYIWDDADNQIGSTATNLTAGTYSVVIYDSGSGCSLTDSITLSAVDDIAPEFTVSSTALEVCVMDIENSTSTDQAQDSYDYYVFSAGDLSLDLDTTLFTDNCSTDCSMEIRWKIEFSDGTTYPTDSNDYETGQPSTTLTNILFPGDPNHVSTITHTITYQIVDCNGNVSLPVSRDIDVNPRPQISN